MTTTTVTLTMTVRESVVRYLEIGGMPLGVYTAITKLVLVANPTVTHITTVAVNAADGTVNIAVNKLTTPTTVQLTATTTDSASWVPGIYVADIKFVNTLTGVVLFSPQYTVVVAPSIS